MRNFMANNVSENRKLAVIKYIECLKVVSDNHEISHQIISKLNSFKPVKDVYSVQPPILSVMMVFGLIQNKNLADLNNLLDDIEKKVIPFAKKYYPEYNLSLLLILIEKITSYRDNIKIVCDNQYELSDFDYEQMTDSDITEIFSDLVNVEQCYQQGQFKLMSIHSEYKDFFDYEQKTILEKISKDSIKKSYEFSFSIGAFCFDISTAAFMSYITFFVKKGQSYKNFYGPSHGVVEIPDKPFFLNWKL